MTLIPQTAGAGGGAGDQQSHGGGQQIPLSSLVQGTWTFLEVLLFSNSHKGHPHAQALTVGSEHPDPQECSTSLKTFCFEAKKKAISSSFSSTSGRKGANSVPENNGKKCSCLNGSLRSEHESSSKEPSDFRGLCLPTGEKYRTKQPAFIPWTSRIKENPHFKQGKVINGKNSHNNEKGHLTLLHSNQKKAEQLFYSSGTGDNFFKMKNLK